MYVLFSGEKKNEEEEKRSITELHILELFEIWVSFLCLWRAFVCFVLFFSRQIIKSTSDIN